MGESKTMKRIRVLHSELNGELGGIESFLYNVYRFIDKEKVEFDFLTISDTPAYGDKFKKMGSTVYKVPKHINFLGYYFAIDKILREGNYDIVHIHKNSAIDILILKVLQRFPNIKVVVHSHNTFPSVGGKLEKLHKFNRKYLYDNADYRLACSDNAGKWMYGNGAFEIIKNGIDTKGFRFCTESTIIGYYYYARKMVGFTLVNLKIRKHIKPIVFIAGIIFMSTIYNKIDITMLSALSTDEAVGYYSYAQRTVNIVLTMCSAVTAIFLPRLSYYYDNEKAVFYKLMDKGFQILCLGVVPLAVGLFLTANQAVVLLYGDSFTPTGTTIKLMCPLILIKGFGDLLCYQLAYSSKNEYILLPGSAIASIINVITNSILIPLYAQNGAVIASVMSELTTNIIQFLYLKRKIKYHISNTALVLSLFSTMVMAAVVCAIIKMNLPLAVALAMEISIGGAIYLLMNIALKNRILSEMLTKVLKKHNTGFQDS